jgi:hypothetical protein
MMRILEELWLGNIAPNARKMVRGSEYDNLVRLLCRNEDKLTALLDEKEKEIFQKYQDAQSEMNDISDRETFISGFRLGAQIMLEVLTGENSQFTDISE